jgi:hypothetical protein
MAQVPAHCAAASFAPADMGAAANAAAKTIAIRIWILLPKMIVSGTAKSLLDARARQAMRRLIAL